MAIRSVVRSLLASTVFDPVWALSTPRNHYLRLPIVRSDGLATVRDVQDRDLTTLPLANRSDIAYYALLEFGSPPQNQYVQLDTGSYELWVNPDCTSLTELSDVRFCEAVGHYDPTLSSTSAPLEGSKTLFYGIGTVTLDYVSDSIRLKGSNTILEKVKFGVASETESEFAGILGLGYGKSVSTDYHNFVDQLAEQGVTDTRAFSLALGGKTEGEGLIIFGGLDLGKFTGKLQTLPIIPADASPDGAPRYWVEVAGISLVPPDGETKVYQDSSIAAFLDSGATMTLLPMDLAQSIAADFGAVEADANGLSMVDCALNDVDGYLDFNFDGITIRVPYSEMIREFETSTGTQCYLGISGSEEFVLLGASMLRSAYVVFDQTNDAIHLAQYTNCGTSEMEITPDLDFGSVSGDCDSPVADHATATPASDTIALVGTPTTVEGISSTLAETSTTLAGVPTTVVITSSSTTQVPSSDGSLTTAAATSGTVQAIQTSGTPVPSTTTIPQGQGDSSMASKQRRNMGGCALWVTIAASLALLGI